jgi:hypothetical protein
MCVHKSILCALCVYLTMYISLKFRASHCVSLCASMFETWECVGVSTCLCMCLVTSFDVFLWLCECLNCMCVYAHHV